MQPRSILGPPSRQVLNHRHRSTTDRCAFFRWGCTLFGALYIAEKLSERRKQRKAFRDVSYRRRKPLPGSLGHFSNIYEKEPQERQRAEEGNWSRSTL